MITHNEIDFLDVESDKSGDAITIRYHDGANTYIHVVDGGFQSTGESIAAHINKYYGQGVYIDAVIVTHNDADHAGGLRYILENCNVGTLWMLRPWLYANEIIHRFSRYSSVESLSVKLREIYSNLAALEDIAIEKGIPIYTPLQGERIGAFHVLAPSKQRYLDLIVESEKTPEAKTSENKSLYEMLSEAAKKAVAYIKSAWGVEVFSQEETSAENEMSVVQYAYLNGHRILLTGDVGRSGLLEAAIFAPAVGLTLPGIDKFQVPHHGSRRNVSTEILDFWVGKRLAGKAEQKKFEAFISSAKKDKDHPRKAVERAMIHRGGVVYKTEGANLRTHGGDAPAREGWISATPADYPEEQEE